MNIIDAWKAAKEGQIIERQSLPGVRRVKGKSLSGRVLSGHVFIDAMVDYSNGNEDKRLFDIHALADDWEVVKEKKKVIVKNVQWKCTEHAPFYGDFIEAASLEFSVYQREEWNKKIVTMTLEWEE